MPIDLEVSHTSSRAHTTPNPRLPEPIAFKENASPLANESGMIAFTFGSPYNHAASDVSE